MSTDYKLEKEITLKELFDGRLESHGVHEYEVEGRSSDQFGVLTDGTNRLAVYADGVVKIIKRCGTNNENRILNAIADEFETDIYSEHSGQFWGYETDEEWEAAEETRQQQAKVETYIEIMKSVRGEPSDISPGTLGATWCKIAKKVISQDPSLALPERMDELMSTVYEGSIVKWEPPIAD
jgi:hypothetical protein